MIIATWNVNSIRTRIEHLTELLTTKNIDVILLQELKCMTEVFPKEYFEDLGYNCAIFGQKSYNGVAILSKYRIEELKLGNEIFQNDSQARYIEALINGYKIASIYVPNGQEVDAPAYKYKLEFLRILKNYLKNEIIENKFIIGGDFNIARSDLDVYNPKSWKGKVCCTDLERDLFEDILNIGFNDCHRDIAQDKAIYTWWDYRHSGFIKNYGLRLDYILTTSNIIIKDCEVDLSIRAKERPSDHAPVIMDI